VVCPCNINGMVRIREMAKANKISFLPMLSPFIPLSFVLEIPALITMIDSIYRFGSTITRYLLLLSPPLLAPPGLESHTIYIRLNSFPKMNIV
jgi:hypothetical protein